MSVLWRLERTLGAQLARVLGILPRVAFYAHDTYGLGHLSRCLKLAEAFAAELPEVRGVILSGSPWHGLFTPPTGFRVVPLPPVIKRAQGIYAPRILI